MKQPEIKVMFDKEYDHEHHQGIYENLKNGEKTRPLWMRVQYAREMADQREEAERCSTKYCPKCHLALPSSGVCDWC